jgi:hypothetical protein
MVHLSQGLRWIAGIHRDEDGWKYLKVTTKPEGSAGRSGWQDAWE